MTSFQLPDLYPIVRYQVVSLQIVVVPFVRCPNKIRWVAFPFFQSDDLHHDRVLFTQYIDIAFHIKR
jgi:hypothetical protein